jgi:hypothetical protein
LQQETLVDTLLCVFGFAIALGSESCDQKGIGSAGNYDIAMGLDERERLLVIAERKV